MKCLFVTVIVFMSSMMAVFPISAAQPLDYPRKNRVITIIVPYPPGGSTDTSARALAPALEKKLGVTIEVANKPGAGSQVGMTEFTAAKPDGYTLCFASFPGTVSPYLDATRKTTYGRKDYKAVSFLVGQPFVLLVAEDSPYRSIKDVIDYAKANPKKFRIALSGILLGPHFSILELEKLSGVKLGTVHFDGEAGARTAFLGGHVEGMVSNVSAAIGIVKGKQARALAVMDNVVNPYLPDAKTMVEQGYPIVMGTDEALLVPSATPTAIIKLLEQAIQEVIKEPQFQEKAKLMNIPMRYKNSAESEQFIDKIENTIKPLIDDVRKSEK